MNFHDETLRLLWSGWFVLLWLAANLYHAYRRGKLSLRRTLFIVAGAAVPFALSTKNGPDGAWALIIAHSYVVAIGLILAGVEPKKRADEEYWRRFITRSIRKAAWVSALAWTCPFMVQELAGPYSIFALRPVQPVMSPASPVEFTARLESALILVLPIVGGITAFAGAICGFPLAIVVAGVGYLSDFYRDGNPKDF